MKNYTQKELKNLVALGAAEDITRGDNETRKTIESVVGDICVLSRHGDLKKDFKP